MLHSHDASSAASIGLQCLTAPLLHLQSAPTASPTFLFCPDPRLIPHKIAMKKSILLDCFSFACAKVLYAQTQMQS